MAFYINPNQLQDADYQALRQFAIKMLARRNHAASELVDKITKRGGDAQLAQQVVADLQQQNLQSDADFIQSAINNAVYRQHGPFKLRQQLQQHALDGALIEEILAANNINWQQLALQLYRRKFTEPVDFQNPREYQKRQRFMQSRGFLDFKIPDDS